MPDPANLVWGLIFGSVGLGFFVYGKSQKMFLPILSGMALMVFPYFVTDIAVMILVGVALAALPFFIRF